MNKGEYVRTKDGDLFILEDIVDNEVIPRNIHLPYAIWKDEIIKHSKKLIDLIQVGDYVNGEKVVNPNGLRWLYKNTGDEVKEIKSILTHEQFKAMEYKVVE